MSDDLISRAAAIAACELFDAPVSKSNWVNAQATAAQQIRGAIRALPGTPTPFDTGADTGPGSIPPQPGEAPVSDAPAPTMADLIDNLMRIEMLTATGEGLDPATTIDVHLLAGIGRAVEDAQATAFDQMMRDAARRYAGATPEQKEAWRKAQADSIRDGWTDEGTRIVSGDPPGTCLPAPPVDSSAAPSTPVDNKISADPVGKEG